MRGAREVLRDARSLPAGDVRLAMGTSAGKWLLDAACLYACTAALGVGLALWESSRCISPSSWSGRSL